LVIYIGDGSFGVPWLAVNKALEAVIGNFPQTQFRVESVITYDDFSPSQYMIWHVQLDMDLAPDE
jgi:hypothetical protein